MLQSFKFICILCITTLNNGKCFSSEENEKVCEPPTTHWERRPDWFNLSFPSDYKKNLPPTKHDCPTNVQVGIYPWKIGVISYASMSFQVDLYLTVQWEDHRLNFTVMQTKHNHLVILDDDEVSKLWIPVIAFRNSMGHNGIVFDSRVDKIRLLNTQLTFVLRRAAKFHCQFHFGSYPMDQHTCYVEIQSMNYKSSIILVPNAIAKGLVSGASPPEFEVGGFKDGTCTGKDRLSVYYSCIEYSFVFKRRISHYIMVTYAPSFLIVALSWISFWLDVDATPPRVALGLTSLLTLATQFSSAQKDLPPVSYVKAIDVWMFACILMVFTGLVEFAVVNYVSRHNVHVIIPVKQKRSVDSASVAITKPQKNDKEHYIDKLSRKLFPSAFLLFNVCYWSYYALV